MDELKRDIKNLIVDYNTTINNYNKTIKNISFTDKVDLFGDIEGNSIITSYTIAYQDGSCQTWLTYDNMKFYLKGMIDGFKLLKHEQDNV